MTYVTISNYSAIIGRNMSLFKVHLFKFIYAMPAVSIDIYVKLDAFSCTYFAIASCTVHVYMHKQCA